MKGQRKNEIYNGKEGMKVFLSGIEKSIKCIGRRPRLN